jgi:hypothetical protein
MKTLHMHFAGCDQMKDAEMSSLAQALPGLQNLSVLQLNLSRTPLQNFTQLGHALKHLQSLTSLHLVLSQCPMVKSVHPLGQALASKQHLTSFHLNLSACTRIQDVNPLGVALAKVPNLVSASCNFRGCASLTMVSELAQALCRQQIGQATLDFRECIGLPNSLRTEFDGLTGISEFVSALVQAEISEGRGVSLAKLLGTCVCLPSFTLNVRKGGEEMNDADFALIARSLGKLKQLRQLTLNFRNCSNLRNLSPLGNELIHLKHLTKLELRFADEVGIESVRQLAMAIGTLQQLRQFDLQWSSDVTCGLNGRDAFVSDWLQDELKDNERLGTLKLGRSRAQLALEALGRFGSVEELNLDICGWGQDTVDRLPLLAKSLAKLVNLTKIKLRFSSCLLADLSPLGRAILSLGSIDLELIFDDVMFLQEQFKNEMVLVDVGSMRSPRGDASPGRSSCDNTKSPTGGLKFSGTKGREHFLMLTFQADIDEGKISPLIETLVRGPKLQTLRLSFMGIADSTLVMLAQGLAELRKLGELSLQFDTCTWLRDISPLAEALTCSSLSGSLRFLKLKFCRCPSLSRGVEELGDVLEKLGNLNGFTLSFEVCPGLASLLQEEFCGVAGKCHFSSLTSEIYGALDQRRLQSM